MDGAIAKEIRLAHKTVALLWMDYKQEVAMQFEKFAQLRNEGEAVWCTTRPTTIRLSP